MGIPEKKYAAEFTAAEIAILSDAMEIYLAGRENEDSSLEEQSLAWKVADLRGSSVVPDNPLSWDDDSKLGKLTRKAFFEKLAEKALRKRDEADEMITFLLNKAKERPDELALYKDPAIEHIQVESFLHTSPLSISDSQRLR